MKPSIHLAAKHDPRRELIARAVIIRDGRILVNHGTRPDDGEAYFALPGGHVDPGESCIQALEREIEEELATTARIGDLIFVAESIYAGRKQTVRHELVLFFRGEISGTLREDGDQIASPEPKKRFRWLPLHQLDDANLYPAALKPLLLNQASSMYSFDDSTRSSSAHDSA